MYTRVLIAVLEYGLWVQSRGLQPSLGGINERCVHGVKGKEEVTKDVVCLLQGEA